MKRLMTVILTLIPIAALSLPKAPAVKWTDEDTSNSVVAPTIQNRDYQRVRIDDLVSHVRYLFQHKQAIILPEGTDPHFLFAYNDNESHITTVVFPESQMMNPASWIVQDILEWTGGGTLRYVSPTAYNDGLVDRLPSAIKKIAREN